MQINTFWGTFAQSMPELLPAIPESCLFSENLFSLRLNIPISSNFVPVHNWVVVNLGHLYLLKMIPTGVSLQAPAQGGPHKVMTFWEPPRPSEGRETRWVSPYPSEIKAAQVQTPQNPKMLRARIATLGLAITSGNCILVYSNSDMTWRKWGTFSVSPYIARQSTSKDLERRYPLSRRVARHQKGGFGDGWWAFFWRAATKPTKWHPWGTLILNVLQWCFHDCGLR